MKTNLVHPEDWKAKFEAMEDADEAPDLMHFVADIQQNAINFALDKKSAQQAVWRERLKQAYLVEQVKMKFKDIKDGEKFTFANPVEFSIGKVFRKISARKYRVVGDNRILGADYKVGTVNVGVNKQ